MSPTTSSCVSSPGRSGSGLGEVICTVSGPVAVNVSPVKYGANWPADFTTYLKSAATDWAVRGEPSENFTPERSFSWNTVLFPPR